jgi:hypothetical protein
MSPPGSCGGAYTGYGAYSYDDGSSGTIACYFESGSTLLWTDEDRLILSTVSDGGEGSIDTMFTLVSWRVDYGSYR